MENQTIIPNTHFKVQQIGAGNYLLKVEVTQRYLMLPIEDKAPVCRATMVIDNRMYSKIDLRLARMRTEYLVPLDVSAFLGKQLCLLIESEVDGTFCWEAIKEQQELNLSSASKFRPLYHFSPAYGWMNDPNGMCYKDGVYHLCYQYNPYGATWGNMSWGHATSRDLVTWQQQEVALSGDGLGAIFSGCAVVDEEGVAGFGRGAIVLFYTSAGIGQTQCMAYSTDNGKSFHKYENNPILTADAADFRDPKVFWHAPTKRWIMLLAVGQHMEIYSSSNLRDWTLESRFGEDEGAHGGVWECPDLFELPIDDSSERRWVLLCSINPGGPCGSSATQYFVGTFDGRRFRSESSGRTKWMDFGMDYYAAVTWSNVPDGRVIALGWMNSWIYGNQTPTAPFRGMDAFPRELSLFRENGELLLRSEPVTELHAFQRTHKELTNLRIDREWELKNIFTHPTAAYVIETEIAQIEGDSIEMLFSNSRNECVALRFDAREGSFSMNRSRSGFTDLNPANSFVGETSGVIFGNSDRLMITILVDACSMEIFGNGGRFVMTNQIFPSEPYNNLRFVARGGGFIVESLKFETVDRKGATASDDQ